MKLTCLVDDAVQPDSGFWGEHGLAYLIEADGQRILFDTGQSGTVLLHNLKLLDIDPATFDAVAISHAHYDHTGVCRPSCRISVPASRSSPTPISSASDSPSGMDRRSSSAGAEPGGVGRPSDLRLSPDPQEIVPGVWTTGEINERPISRAAARSSSWSSDGELVADAYRDDMALVLRSDDHLAPALRLLPCRPAQHPGARGAPLSADRSR